MRTPYTVWAVLVQMHACVHVKVRTHKALSVDIKFWWVSCTIHQGKTLVIFVASDEKYQ